MNNIKSFFNSKPFFIFILFSFLIIQGKQSDHYFKWIHPDRINSANLLSIHTDGSGYYAYLPQWFIYQSKNEYSHLEKITSNYNTYSFISGVNFDYEKKKGTNKYFVGTAICSTPVFLINHVINKLLYGEGDGYSRSYQFTVALNALLYWFIGVIAIIFLLKDWCIKRFWILFFIAILTFGTSLNFYTVYFPSFSHVYSFAAISWFLYFANRWAKDSNNINFIRMVFFLAMVFCIRPTNILIALFIPFFFNDFKSFLFVVKNQFFQKLKYIIIAVGILFVFILIQFLNVYAQIGEFKFNLYNNEHFDFIINPQLFNVLFGYKKGFFVYAPVMLLTFIGLIYLFLKEKYKFLIWLFVASLFLYLTSSWWCWWYGGGLGMRPFVDILFFISLPIIYLLKENKKWLNYTLFSIALPLVWVYQIYQIQFNKIILHYDKMDKVNFWRIFLKTDMRFSWSAEFKDEKLPKSNIQFTKTYFGDFKSKSFSSNRKKLNSINFNTNLLDDPTFVVVNDFKSNNYFGLKIGLYVSIYQPESNPNIEVFYYYNGKEIKKSNAYIGYRIPNLNNLTPVKLEFYPRLKLSEIDSFSIKIGKGIIPTKYKDFTLKLSTYEFKK